MLFGISKSGTNKYIAYVAIMKNKKAPVWGFMKYKMNIVFTFEYLPVFWFWYPDLIYLGQLHPVWLPGHQ